MNDSLTVALAKMAAISEAYAEAIQANADADPEARTLAGESMAATVAGLTCLHKATREQGLDDAKFLQLASALVNAVINSADSDGAERGGLVSDMLRDMEGF